MEDNTLKNIEKILKKDRKENPSFTIMNLQTIALTTRLLGVFAHEIICEEYNTTTKERNKYLKKAKEIAIKIIVIMIRFLEGD